MVVDNIIRQTGQSGAKTSPGKYFTGMVNWHIKVKFFMTENPYVGVNKSTHKKKKKSSGMHKLQRSIFGKDFG